jgi:hypothetical protein
LFHHILLSSFNRYPVKWCERVYSAEQHFHCCKLDYGCNRYNSRIFEM